MVIMINYLFKIIIPWFFIGFGFLFYPIYYYFGLDNIILLIIGATLILLGLQMRLIYEVDDIEKTLEQTHITQDILVEEINRLKSIKVKEKMKEDNSSSSFK